ncbi:unnamed protein product [Miscanthus lutarioriparius]|uniref:Uncharacterized protein n=1 Tax=Miscanthus lutarioriparius TaxID=422564 RepID=A0A811R5C8_9POAL|nr:unnamed protein product [Miscanthus lutarioriparius]
MKRRHLPPVLLLLLTLSLLSLSFRRHMFLPRGPSPYAAAALLRWLATTDVDGDQVVAEAAALFANASVSSFPSLGNHHRILYLRLPYHSNTTSAPRQRVVSRLRVPFDTLPSDESLLAAFRASLLAHRHRRGGDVAGIMGELTGQLGRPWRFPTCAVVGNSGILLGFGRGT